MPWYTNKIGPTKKAGEPFHEAKYVQGRPHGLLKTENCEFLTLTIFFGLFNFFASVSMKDFQIFINDIKKQSFQMAFFMSTILTHLLSNGKYLKSMYKNFKKTCLMTQKERNQNATQFTMVHFLCKVVQ